MDGVSPWGRGFAVPWLEFNVPSPPRSRVIFARKIRSYSYLRLCNSGMDGGINRTASAVAGRGGLIAPVLDSRRLRDDPEQRLLGNSRRPAARARPDLLS